MKIFIIVAITVDGYIARHTDQLADWTSKEDKQFFIKMTKQAGVMVMGSTTFATMGKALPGRRTIVYTPDPNSISAENIETTDEEPAELVKRLESDGVKELAICGGSTIYTMFLNSGVVDEIYLTVEPVFFGTGIKLFNQSVEKSLELIESKQINPDSVMLHYLVRNAK